MSTMKHPIRAALLLGAMLAPVAAWGGAPIATGPSATYPGGAPASTNDSRFAWVTPQLMYSKGMCSVIPGTGGDDSSCINAAINSIANAAGNAVEVFLPSLSAGKAYNVCASNVTIPSQTSVFLHGGGAGVTLQTLPSCGSPPTSVIYQTPATGNSSAKFTISNMRVDGYCLSAHDMDIAYSANFFSHSVTYRNVATGGSNVRIESGTQNGLGYVGFGENLGTGNLIENVNDSGNTCYTSANTLPNYNLETWGTDSNFTGLVAQDAYIANFYEGSSGGDNIFGPGTHGWGIGPQFGTDLRPQYTYYINGFGSKIEGVADSFTSAGVRIGSTGNGVMVNGVLYEGNSGGVPATAVGVLIDTGRGGDIISNSIMSGIVPANMLVSGTGFFDNSIIFHDNIGQGPAPSAENKIINGSFSIDQIHGGSTATYLAGGGYFIDQWTFTGNAGAYFQASPVNSSAGCGKERTGVILTASGSVTPTASQFSALSQPIDGAMMADALWGGSPAQNLILSFYASSSTAGTESISVINGGQTRGLLEKVALTTSCQYFAIPIPGDTAVGYWNGSSAQTEATVNFDLCSGANYQSSNLGTWQNVTPSTRPFEYPGSLCASNTSVQITLTQVRLRIGYSDVPWLHRTPYEELRLAQNYVRSSFLSGTAPSQNAGVTNALCVNTPIAAAYLGAAVRFDTPMAKTPTITTYNPSAANANWRNVTGSADVPVSANPASNLSVNGFQLSSSGTVATANSNVCIGWLALGQL